VMSQVRHPTLPDHPRDGENVRCEKARVGGSQATHKGS